MDEEQANRLAITRGERRKIEREDAEMRARGIEPFTGVWGHIDDFPEGPTFDPPCIACGAYGGHDEGCSVGEEEKR
jgi:hypothetical protein